MNKIFTFFDFNRRERRGIILLLSILFTLVVTIHIMPYFYVENISEYDVLIAENFIVSDSVSNLYKKQNYVQRSINSTSSTDYSTSSNYQHQPFRRTKKPFTVQANSCDTLDLQEIRGIGSILSKRIINYREKLGGFVRKEQLLEVWGIDSTRYEMIKNAFIINSNTIKKININNISINELKQHPYLDYYQAKAIVREREKQLYGNVDEIQKIEIIDDETFDLIKEYLTVE